MPSTLLLSFSFFILKKKKQTSQLSEQIHVAYAFLLPFVYFKRNFCTNTENKATNSVRDERDTCECVTVNAFQCVLLNQEEVPRVIYNSFCDDVGDV